MLPSLLYTENPIDKKISLSVFRDLQLLNFIPEDSARCVLRVCTLQDRQSREKLFSRLAESDSSFEKFLDFSETARRSKDAEAIYSSARTVREKEILFLKAVSEYVLLVSAASECDFGDPFTKILSDAFSSIGTKEKYRNLLSDLPEAVRARERIFALAVRVDGEKVFLSDEIPGGSFCRRIETDSEKLGIEFNKSVKNNTERLSPDIIEAAAEKAPVEMKIISDFYSRYSGLYDSSVKYYYDECMFYISFVKLFREAEKYGIPIRVPKISDEKIIKAENAYDISLLAKGEHDIVPNDIDFSVDEPFYYLTGANDGGKTTYLRTVGILTVLTLIGCPVPADSAEIGEINCVYTHFPRDERFDGSGRFVEENKRVEKILASCDGASLVLLNETFSATNEESAVKYTSELANRLYGEGIFGLYITHQHDLKYDEKIPFLHVVIDESDNNRRTFKVVKSRNTGGSFAYDILKRHGLTPDDLKERFEPLIEAMDEGR